MAKRRLDSVLTERGLFPSRSRAAASVMAGEVRIGADERPAHKPGELVDPQERLSVRAPARFVSRGGIKLANALASTGLDVSGRRALDVGASTGGFSDCLLQAGVSEVIAVDVGYGTLAWSLRSDPRVHVMERTNARELMPQMLPFRPEVAVVDVSFISLAKVLGTVLACMGQRHDVLALVKPQFELGRGRVGKGGVVRDAGARRAAMLGVAQAALALGAVVLGFHPSGLPGPKGNRETFIWLCEPGRLLAGPGRRAAGVAGRLDARAQEQLERMVSEAEW